MGYAVYSLGPRHGGYGVPSICEHPECKKEIDRGISYACGGTPENGCDRFFCEKHLNAQFPENEEDEEDFEYMSICDRCVEGKESFPYKPETKEWIEMLTKDESWEERRKGYPTRVIELINSGFYVKQTNP